MVNAPAPPYVPAKYQGGPQRPDRIVLHSAVCDLYPGAALAIARYGQHPDDIVSWHYTVDNHHRLYGSMGDSATYQCVWDETTAWHDGDNHNSIGIEMCERPSWDIGRWNSAAHRKLMENTAALVRQLCLAYGIPMRWLSHGELRARRKGIVTHDDVSKTFGVSSHWDPGAFPKDEFMAMVNQEDDVSYDDAYRAIRDVLWGEKHPTLVDGSEYEAPLGQFIRNGDLHSYHNRKMLEDVYGDRYDVPGRPEDADNPKYYFTSVIQRLFNNSVQHKAQAEALIKAVEALSTDPNLSAERVEQIVRDAVAQNIEITGNVEIGGAEQ